MLTKQDVDAKGHCKVCGQDFMPGGHYDRARLLEVGICPDCDHDMDKWRMRNDPETARIGGQHYRYGNHLQDARITQDTTLGMLAEEFGKANPPKQGLGMGGRVVIIRFNDGRVVITNDLWHQGDVPESMRANWLTDNAVFLEKQQ